MRRLYWLELLAEMNLLAQDILEPVRKECDELLAIFVTTGKTAKTQKPKQG